MAGSVIQAVETWEGKILGLLKDRDLILGQKQPSEHLHYTRGQYVW